MNRPGRRLTLPALSSLILLASSACASHPLGTPVPNAESMAVRGELAALLLSSGQHEAAAREYQRLLRFDAREEHRLGLARALAWGGRHREAETQLRVLAALRPRDAAVDALLRSVRANLEPGVAEAESWLAERPTYTPYRAALARALAAEGRLDEAVAQLGIVLATEPEPDLLVERAALHVRRRDHGAAEDDLRRAIAIEPGAAAWIALGDLHRRRGELDEARVAFQSARWLAPGDPAVAAAFARLERDERPALAGLPIPGREPGYGVAFAGVRDNAGIAYTQMSVRRGFRPGPGTSGTVELGYRHLREAGTTAGMASHGFAAEAAVARWMSRGEVEASVGAGAGLVYHGGTAPMPTGRLALQLAYRAWIAGVGLAAGPAYPSLMTGAALRPDEGTGALREQGLTMTVGGPVGRTDAALVWQRAQISDGNIRTVLTVTARHPLAGRLSAVYAGQGIAYAARSPLYWDPSGYVANAVGLELAERRVRGLSVVARGRVGLAWTDEAPFTRIAAERGEPGARFRLDFASDLGYRAEGWDARLSYAFGRVSDYRRHEATLLVSLEP